MACVSREDSADDHRLRFLVVIVAPVALGRSTEHAWMTSQYKSLASCRIAKRREIEAEKHLGGDELSSANPDACTLIHSVTQEVESSFFLKK